jgi:hypothetical protein
MDLCQTHNVDAPIAYVDVAIAYVDVAIANVDAPIHAIVLIKSLKIKEK